MRVLIACEFSGRVREAFARRGHFTVSADLLPTDTPTSKNSRHHKGDVEAILGDGWDLMIAHPPCTYLARSGIHWNARIKGRSEKTDEALGFVRRLFAAPIPRIAIENPIGVISTRIRKPDQVVQPWMFGDDAQKTTCLWLVNLPHLKETNVLRKERYANQTASGQNRLPPSADRWKKRSETYPGFAEAMAEQWGALPVLK